MSLCNDLETRLTRSQADGGRMMEAVVGGGWRVEMAWSEDVKERKEATEQLRDSFVDLLEKKQAWTDLHKLTQDKNKWIRESALDTFILTFHHYFKQIP